MTDETFRTLLQLLPPVSSLAVLGVAWRLARQSSRYEKGLETIERVGPAVEGDPTEHEDNAKRHGALGRLTTLEGVTFPLARMLRAVLRGMNVPSDLSDPVKLEAAVKERLRTGSVDTLAAIQALTERSSDAPDPPIATEPDLPPAHPHAVPRRRIGAPWKKEPK